MDPLSVLGAAAIGAMGVCAATDCAEPKALPQVSVVQRAETTPPALEPPRCPPAPQPVQLTCAPQQSVHCPVPPERKMPRKVAAPRSLIEVHVSCPDKSNAIQPPMSTNVTMTNVIGQAGAEKATEKRPQELKISAWISSRIAGFFALGSSKDEKPDPPLPSVTSILTLLLTLFVMIQIPMVAGAKFGGRRRNPSAKA